MTEQDLAAAEKAVEEAEEALDAAEHHHAIVGSERAGGDLKMAQGRAHNARDNLRRLRSVWAGEQQARARRDTAEVMFEAEAPVMAARLARARDEAACAVTEAQRAVGRLLDVVAAYDDAVRGAAGELKNRGLSADNGEPMGGTNVGGVRLDGELWMPVGAMDLLAAVMAGAVGERDRQHPLAGLRWQHAGGLPTKTARDELLRRAAR